MKQVFKTLKWFSLEWDEDRKVLFVIVHNTIGFTTKTEQQAFDWLEANGYIERIKE